MDNYHKELLMEIIDEWSDSQLLGYLIAQEERLENTRKLIRELKEIQRKRKKTKPVETGARGGV